MSSCCFEDQRRESDGYQKIDVREKDLHVILQINCGKMIVLEKLISKKKNYEC